MIPNDETEIIWLRKFALHLPFLREATIRKPLRFNPRALGPVGSITLAHSAGGPIIRVWFLYKTDRFEIDDYERGLLVDPQSIAPRRISRRRLNRHPTRAAIKIWLTVSGQRKFRRCLFIRRKFMRARLRLYRCFPIGKRCLTAAWCR